MKPLKLFGAQSTANLFPRALYAAHTSKLDLYTNARSGRSMAEPIDDDTIDLDVDDEADIEATDDRTLVLQPPGQEQNKGGRKRARLWDFFHAGAMKNKCHNWAHCKKCSAKGESP